MSMNEMMNLISKGKGEQQQQQQERELELRLGPPGEDHNENKRARDSNNDDDDDSSLPLSLGNNYLSTHKTHHHQDQGLLGKAKASSYLKLPSISSRPQNMMQLPTSQHFCPKVVELHAAEKEVFLTTLPNTSHKRTSASAVVGWPPVRSYRKNISSGSTSSNSKLPLGPHHHHNPLVVPNKNKNKVDAGKEHVEHKGLFVKINMDGIPIGRKVNIHAYGSYHKLSSAVDFLFRDLLAGQRDSSAVGNENKQLEEEKAITCGLDGSGEYTIVYEDHEGDKMLLGDVPWDMFVSTVKRLRVLKSSDFSAISLGSKQRHLKRQ